MGWVGLVCFSTRIPVVTPSIISWELCPELNLLELSLWMRIGLAVSLEFAGRASCKIAVIGGRFFTVPHSTSRSLRVVKWATALFTHGSTLLSLMQLCLLGERKVLQSSIVICSGDWGGFSDSEGSAQLSFSDSGSISGETSSRIAVAMISSSFILNGAHHARFQDDNFTE